MREKLIIRVKPEILKSLRDMAHGKSHQLQALIDEALADLIKKHRQAEPRPHVMNAYQASHDTFGTLYRKLAQ